MLGRRPANTPIDSNHGLKGGVSDRVDRERYQRLVGRLIYLSHTRPDISYVVSAVSRYMHNPRVVHQEAVDCILRYLKGCPERGLLIEKNKHMRIEMYTDADWADCQDDRKSTSGHCAFSGGNLVSWRSKKQNVVARSIAEAEYRAMALGVSEGVWLQRLLLELGLREKSPIMLYCINKAAINIANNPVQHDRTKHVEVDRHFIKEKLDNGEIRLPFVRTTEQLADVFTKGLHTAEFSNIICKMNMKNIYSSS
jgi:hypothetical protein